MVSFLGVEILEKLNVGKNATYTSHHVLEDMQDAAADVIDEQLNHKLLYSPYVSVLADESTDLAVTKKLCIYARALVNFVPETLFIKNVEISDGTAVTIYKEIEKLLQEKNIILNKCIGLGSDGAAVMTGARGGVARLMKDKNPYLENVHCIAHRLALLMSQAANQVPYMKRYREVITSLFYYFKKSAVRTHGLQAIQEVLDCPQLKIKEVHDVRWFAFYSALETVYRSYEALCVLFSKSAEEKKDQKATGLLKDLSGFQFLATTHLLMDVIPVLTHLNLIFQKKDLDLSVIYPAIEGAKSQILAMQNGKRGAFLSKLMESDNIKMYKGIEIKDTLQDRKAFEKNEKMFLRSILEEFDHRFPEETTSLIKAFSVLSLRGVNFQQEDDLVSWGNDSIDVLCEQYGTNKADSAGTMMEAHINPHETQQEWINLKALVRLEKYPTDHMATLWKIINQYHAETYPNLLKLAAMALVFPVHTADVERGFSSQNMVKSHYRNRLSSARLQNILLVRVEGAHWKEFDYGRALAKFRGMQKRRIFRK